MHTTNASQHVVNSSFRDRFPNKGHWRDQARFTTDTKLKYNSYKKNGMSIFTVTLSTYISSEKIAKSDRMRKFWVREFLYRVSEQLPYKLKELIDYDFVIERSPEGHYHYHGLLGMPKEAGDRLWNCGALNRELVRDLSALRTTGGYRDFAVNSVLMEPIRPGETIDAWVHYMTKTPDYISSSAW